MIFPVFIAFYFYEFPSMYMRGGNPNYRLLKCDFVETELWDLYMYYSCCSI